MKKRSHPTRRVSSYLLALTLPVANFAGLTMCSVPVCAQDAKAAQDAKPVQDPKQSPVTTPGQDTKTPTATQTPPITAGAVHIGEIVVIGNKTLSASYIIAASGHKVGDPCSDQTLAEMKTNLYQTGNFGMHSTDAEEAVRVRSEEPNPPTGMCKVVIEVDENDTIKGINITGSGPIKNEDIRAAVHVTENKTVYNPNQFLRDTADIQDMYARRGYIATFAADTGPDEKNPSFLNIDIVVTRVSKIDIVKNHKTRRYVILREMKTKEGDYFNRITFNNDLRRLYNLDLFEEVTPAEEDLGPGRIGITLSVPEKRTGVISAGVGFSNRSQLIGRAEVTESNFRGVGQTLSLLWETGGAVNRNSVELGFTEPWLDRRHTTLNVQLYDKTVYRFSNTLSNNIATNNVVGTDNRYNEQRTGGALTFSRPFRDTYRAGITLRDENVRTDLLGLSIQNAEIIQNGPIFSVSGSLLHNTRDLDLDPVTGVYQSLSIQVGHADLKPVTTASGATAPGPTGSVNFIKPSLELRQYFPLAGVRKRNKPDEDKPALALRLIVGGTSGTVPFFEQFFVGGAESLRGYREDRYWGSNMVLGSMEYRQPLARRLKGVLFADVGDAWGGSFSNVTISGFNQSAFTLHPAVGAGIRVGTPIGPLRLDFGYGSEGGRTHFSIGNVF